MKLRSTNYTLHITIFFLVLTSCFLLLTSSVIAQTKTPTPTATKSSPTPTTKPLTNIDNQINDLKERIASRVAQLKLVEKKGVIGTVTDVSGTQITITDTKNETRFIDVDEITKFSSPSAKGSFGLSDITKGSKVGVLGLFNKQSQRVMARFVDVLITPTTLHGVVAAIDADEFTLLVQQENGQKTIIDVEAVTKTLSHSKKDGIVRSGFSKIKEGTRVVVVGFPNAKDKKRIIASRILLLPEVPHNPKINLIQDALDPKTTVVPSTGSGTKLTPLTR